MQNTTVQKNNKLQENFLCKEKTRVKDISFDEFYETLEERMFGENEDIQEAIDDFFSESEYIQCLNDYLFEKKMEEQGEEHMCEYCESKTCYGGCPDEWWYMNSPPDPCEFCGSMNCSGYCADDEEY
jgi:hypothetical protein